jgi:YHS domain-containing protein
MGDKIDKSLYVDHMGKRVYFCCDLCPPKFNKDPMKYIKELEEEGVTLEKAPAGASGGSHKAMEHGGEHKEMDHSKHGR